MDKLYEDNALGAIEPDRYEQLSQKYAEEYYPLKKELEEIRWRLSENENQSQRAKKFIQLVESYCNFEPNGILTTRINNQTFITEIFFNHDSNDTFQDKLLKVIATEETT